MSRRGMFSDIRVAHGPCVYVAELSNGLVKIGRSNNPRTRLQSLQTAVRRHMGAEVCRFAMTGRLQSTASSIAREKQAISAASLEAQHIGGEFFARLKFERATELARIETVRKIHAHLTDAAKPAAEAA